MKLRTALISLKKHAWKRSGPAAFLVLTLRNRVSTPLHVMYILGRYVQEEGPLSGIKSIHCWVKADANCLLRTSALSTASVTKLPYDLSGVTPALCCFWNLKYHIYSSISPLCVQAHFEYKMNGILPGKVPDLIIRRATQTMDRPAQFFSEENTKHYNQKLFLDQWPDYFILISST